MDRIAYKSDDVLFRDTHVGLASSIAANLNGLSNGSTRPPSGFSDQVVPIPNVRHDGTHRHHHGNSSTLSVAVPVAIYRHGETDSCGNITAVPVATASDPNLQTDQLRQHRSHRHTNNNESATLITEALVRAKHVEDPSANWLRTQQQQSLAVTSRPATLPGEPLPENVANSARKPMTTSSAIKTARRHPARRLAKNSRNGCQVSRTPSTTSSSSTGSLICGGGSDERRIVKLTAKQPVPIPSTLSTPAASLRHVVRRRRTREEISRGGVATRESDFSSSSIVSNPSDHYCPPSLIDASVLRGRGQQPSTPSRSSKTRHSVSLSPSPELLEIRHHLLASRAHSLADSSSQMRSETAVHFPPARKMWTREEQLIGTNGNDKHDVPAFKQQRRHTHVTVAAGRGHTASCSMSHPSDESCSASYSSWSGHRDEDEDDRRSTSRPMSIGSSVGPSAKLPAARQKRPRRSVAQSAANDKHSEERLPTPVATDGQSTSKAPTQRQTVRQMPKPAASHVSTRKRSRGLPPKSNKRRRTETPACVSDATLTNDRKKQQSGRRGRKTITKPFANTNAKRPNLRSSVKNNNDRRVTRGQKLNLSASSAVKLARGTSKRR